MAAKPKTEQEKRSVATMIARQGNKDIGKLAKSHGVTPQTIRDWQRRYGITVDKGHAESASGMPSGGTEEAVNGAAAQDNLPGSPDIAELGPPEHGEIGYWRARDFLSTVDEETVLFGPSQLPDGRHTASYAIAARHPRQGPQDSNAGAFEIIGIPGREAGDSADDDNGFRRPEWIQKAPKLDSHQAEINWLIRCMWAEPEDWGADSSNPNVLDEYPLFEAMCDAAVTYHNRTGDFAFPIYIEEQYAKSHVHPEKMLIDLLDPNKTAWVYADQVPAGFGIISREEVAARHPSGEADWDSAFSVMENAAEVYNDQARGQYVEAIIGIFGSDHEAPGAYQSTGCVRTEQLLETSKETLRDLLQSDSSAE